MVSSTLRGAARQVLGALVLFAALLAFGLITRPAAQALPWIFGFHAVLVAPLSAFALSFSLREGLLFPVAASAVVLFSLLLFLMSPVMGASSLAPMTVAGVAYGALREPSERAAFAVGSVYGALFYPCTIVSSLALGALPVVVVQDSAFVVLTAVLLGAVLAVFGAVLATGSADKK